jgi:hypothetical protein
MSNEHATPGTATTPSLVQVEVVEPHSYAGVWREAGTTYEAEEPYLEFLELTAKWVRRVEEKKDKTSRRK